ncbi:MAG: VWA domain-containing protein, partial [Myxococcota bacterium]
MLVVVVAACSDASSPPGPMDLAPDAGADVGSDAQVGADGGGAGPDGSVDPDGGGAGPDGSVGSDGGADALNPGNRMLDTDCDGLSDQEEFATIYADGSRTNPNLADTDGDDLPDGLEVGRTAAVPGTLCAPPPVADADPGSTTSPTVDDTDGDGLRDGIEDRNRNGRVDPGETDPAASDSDGDRLADGLEDANQNGSVDTGETNPALADTDADGIEDGVEDANRNGSVDLGETDPRLADTDGDTLQDGAEDANVNGLREPGETDPTSGIPSPSESAFTGEVGGDAASSASSRRPSQSVSGDVGSVSPGSRSPLTFASSAPSWSVSPSVSASLGSV